MDATELKDLFRDEIVDVELPQMWSDPVVYTYLDEAQKQFCRLTYGIEDARSFTLSITSGTNWYSLDPSILKIRSATDVTTGDAVPLIALEKMGERRMKFDGRIGPLKALITGAEARKVHAWPVPTISSTRGARTDDTDYALDDVMLVTVKGNVRAYKCTTAGTSALAQGRLYTGAIGEVVTDGTAVFTGQPLTAVCTVALNTFRLPECITATSVDLEIDEQHHIPLLDWVKFRAYMKHDVEVYDERKAAKHRSAFEAYCADAKVEQSRLRRPVSMVSYGGL